MFRPNCRAIFRLIFEQVVCTVDYAFNLRDLVNFIGLTNSCNTRSRKLQELFKLILELVKPILVIGDLVNFKYYQLYTPTVQRSA